jgi:hypothetical protein
MSRALNQQFHPNTRRRWRAGSAVPWRAAGRREAHWVQIAESERQVTTLDPPPATTRLLIDFLKVIGAGKAEITTPQAADLLNVSPPYIGGLVDKVRCLHAWHAISGVRCGSTEGAAKVNGPDLQRQPTGEACAPAVQTTSFSASGRAECEVQLPTNCHTGSIKCFSDRPGCCWCPIGLTSSQIEISDFR